MFGVKRQVIKVGLFDFLGKSAKQRERERAEELAWSEDLEVYSGMQVEVSSDDGRMFLAAGLTDLRGDRAQLKPRMDGSLLTKGDGPIPVTIRGFSSRENRAVVMKGRVRLSPGGSWQVERLALVKKRDNRASVRIDVDLDGFLSFEGLQEPCHVVNMSTGGVCVSTPVRHNVGEKLILWLTLPVESGTLTLPFQILRINERRHGYFEYGCKFLEMDGEQEDRLIRSIFELHGYR